MVFFTNNLLPSMFAFDRRCFEEHLQIFETYPGPIVSPAIPVCIEKNFNTDLNVNSWLF
jgi:hypothetical protein